MAANYSKTVAGAISTTPGKQLSSKVKLMKGILTLDAANNFKDSIAEEIAKKHERQSFLGTYSTQRILLALLLATMLIAC